MLNFLKRRTRKMRMARALAFVAAQVQIHPEFWEKYDDYCLPHETILDYFSRQCGVVAPVYIRLAEMVRDRGLTMAEGMAVFNRAGAYAS